MVHVEMQHAVKLKTSERTIPSKCCVGRMPSPIITAFRPTLLYDTHPNQTVTLQGTNFGRPLSSL
eukprot:2989608-Amphidinium_carterae.1